MCFCNDGGLYSLPSAPKQWMIVRVIAHEIYCPRDVSPLSLQDHAASDILACTVCSGLWVPKSSLAGRFDAEAARSLFHSSEGNLTDLRCPVDRSFLWERSIKGILIDQCNSCGGLWFDPGELQSLLVAVDFKHPALTVRPTPKSVKKPADHSMTFDILGGLVEGGIEITGEVLVAVVKFVASAVTD